MLKIFVAVALCLYLSTTVQSASIDKPAEESKAPAESGNSTSLDVVSRRKRNVYYYGGAPAGPGFGPAPGYVPFDNSYWFNTYPTTFTVTSCTGTYACPPQCPGVCGTWSGLSACRTTGCPLIGDPCNAVNIARGLFLHPFAFDSAKYVQCDSAVGVFYIRNCPPALVFDARSGVCNYPQSLFNVWGWRSTNSAELAASSPCSSCNIYDTQKAYKYDHVTY